MFTELSHHDRSENSVNIVETNKQPRPLHYGCVCVCVCVCTYVCMYVCMYVGGFSLPFVDIRRTVGVLQCDCELL